MAPGQGEGGRDGCAVRLGAAQQEAPGKQVPATPAASRQQLANTQRAAPAHLQQRLGRLRPLLAGEQRELLARAPRDDSRQHLPRGEQEKTAHAQGVV